MKDNAIVSFGQNLRGALIDRGHPEYGDVRKLYNGMIDKRPLAIVRCADIADVIATVNFARDNGLLIAIRGGGHNGAGLGSCDDGLVVDLSLMKGIQIDPSRRTVRAGPGCTTGDVDHATHAFGLAVPTGIISTTGIAGLTLGGGTGYLTRQYGLTIDNFIEADVVLADGSFLTASETQNSDLFWALRGGGGNFGVVTNFVLQAHPVRIVYAGPMFWSHEHASILMQCYRDFLPKAPPELYSFLGLKIIPASDPFPRDMWGQLTWALVSCFNGPREDGEKALTPMLEALPQPQLNWMQLMPFPMLQNLFDKLLPKGLQWYWKGSFVKTLPDEAIAVHIQYGERAPSEKSTMHLYPINGAVHRIGSEETAWSTRDATWSMVIAGIDPDPQKAQTLKQWSKTYWEALQPYTCGAGYVNFMMDDEGDSRVKATYADNYGRLAALKSKYDPSNFFRVNQNISPAGRSERRAAS
jgi:FAD/FMN-containing dehydrogenase